ncbi:MFS transporter [Rathayibacter sp. AY1E9]|uniref:glucuronide transporter n=1 Tax=unclassified Rathayibacter TaxID=2609250 RepID=UPI000CE7574C|nr:MULTISPECIES: glucuronide transporter [unclassified Rathayibacter]PPF73129.1 MFS transporter [Rathayibacter sp. AY1E6]PPG16872.1 MFS transporter [Rathayibacter sp. AY1E8]PPG18034.1 MFS transporter [Rathayibacter sp. AY1C6]PPG52405.1 MFS transporter [Rathayibacter sp. AY1E9]PPG60651.1 MFS transporter [Rathayibacter sp. AY1C5]
MTPRTTAPGAPAAEKLSKLSIVGYGAGDTANNLAFTTATMFLLVYYTDVAGISAAAAGTLLLVVRIFDAFADVFAGRVVDRTYSRRFGKFRPFLMFGSVPLLLLSAATFSVPQIGESGTLLYAYLSYAALGLAYSLVNIPYGSLAGAMTQVGTERAKLASARAIGGAIVGAGLGTFMAPLVVPGADLQSLFSIVTLSFVVVGSALYLFTILTAKERVQRDVAHVTFRQSMTTLRSNRPLLFLCLSSFLFLTGTLALQTVQLYYLRDVLGSVQLYAAMSLIQLALTFGLAALVPTIVRRFGKRNAYMAGVAVLISGGTVVFLAPGDAVAVGFGGLVLAYVGIQLVNMLVWAIEADTVEYGEWKTGIRSEGTIYALFSFTRKTGQAVGGALAAYALAWGGYVAGAAEQSEHAEWGIRAAAGLIPAVAALLAVLIMAFYPLTDRRHAQIVAEIAERRESTGQAAPVAPGLSTAAFSMDRAPGRNP